MKRSSPDIVGVGRSAFLAAIQILDRSSTPAGHIREARRRRASAFRFCSNAMVAQTPSKMYEWNPRKKSPLHDFLPYEMTGKHGSND
jgi:hypothetical protein